jgi:hypothetical protein
MMEEKIDLNAEAERAKELLKGKVVVRAARHREAEVMVEFTDRTRLYVDRCADGVELSIAGGIRSNSGFDTR